MNTHRHTFFAFALVASAALLAGCAGGSGSAVVAPEENPVNHESTPQDLAFTASTAPLASDSVVLWVNGLGCPLCATNIDKQLERVKGVEKVAVDLGQGKVTLGLKPGAAHPSPARLKEAVEDAGFTLVKVDAQPTVTP
jgi:copper chaperone CopZ